MQTIYLSHSSSAAYWGRYAGSTPRPSDIPFDAIAIPDPYETARQLAYSSPARIRRWIAADGKLHLLAPSSGKRRRTHFIETHPVNRAFGEGSFSQIEPNVYALSPACCYALSARRMTVPAACLLANEICGTFILPERYLQGRKLAGHLVNAAKHNDSATIPRRSPLATITVLKAYAEREYLRNTKSNAKRALAWAADGSRSPIEAKLAVLLCLPYRYGGWSIALPEMNARIDISQEAQHVLGVPYSSCDLLWRKPGIAIEYYGKEAHSGENRAAHDWEREIIIQDTGFEVLPIHALQLSDPRRFAVIAKYIKKRLGERYRAREPQHSAAVRELRKQLADYENQRW